VIEIMFTSITIIFTVLADTISISESTVWAITIWWVLLSSWFTGNTMVIGVIVLWDTS
jgi:hypothetical protein